MGNSTSYNDSRMAMSILDCGRLVIWPRKNADDLAMVYVLLLGDTYSEALTVTVAQPGSELRIAGIEWGRP
ncbi:MAG: hypothetical protein IIB77_08710 [Proteobacteria bacterium]|nr:hypothetical protein [Pseudomonadota bacterium]